MGDSMTIDTSKEAVERLALLHEGIVFAEATGARQCLVDVDDARFMHTLAAERDAQTARADAAEAEVAQLQDENARLREAVTMTLRADNLREVYHAMPNDHNRIGDKRSRKGHARDAWLRAFRKAAKLSRAALQRKAGE